MKSNHKPHINNEIISASDFINEYESGEKKIERSYIIPPELGKPGFGKIFVTFGISKECLPRKSNQTTCS